MTKKYEVGDKLRYVGVHGRYFTNGEIYEVTGEDMYSVYVNNDHGTGYGLSGIYLRDNFELVDEPTPVEASQSVIELLANLSHRLYEAEKEITELNEKQAVFFDIDKLLKNRIFDLERQNRVQAYEINELYREVADRG